MASRATESTSLERVPRSAGAALQGTLWVVTSYFNPMCYQRRLAAYRTFRAALGVPLVAVELGFSGRFELQKEDADVLLQIPGGDVMWQKERLLNLSLSALPDSCDKVAWLDCDILFERDDWPAQASRALNEHPLVQLFRDVHYLGPDWRPWEPPHCGVIRTRHSVASGVTPDRPAAACLAHPSPDERPGTFANGLAWAARRELIGRHGFYDACIIGGGDRAMSCGAYGCFDHLFEWQHFNAQQRRHYLRWAEPFHACCRGLVGVLDGDVYHLWHGKAADRGLGTRHQGLRQFGFDPFRDIAPATSGCWRWSSAKPALHAYVRDYFASRREDGS